MNEKNINTLNEYTKLLKQQKRLENQILKIKQECNTILLEQMKKSNTNDFTINNVIFTYRKAYKRFNLKEFESDHPRVYTKYKTLNVNESITSKIIK